MPGLADALPAEGMDEIAAGWRELAAILKDQSERKTCNPSLFEGAGDRVARLANAEQRFFEDTLKFCQAGPCVV